MRIEDMKKIVDCVTNIQKKQGVKIDINSMPDGFMFTAFDDTNMINREYISECENVGEAICTIERLKKYVNFYKEKKKEAMKNEENKKLEYLEEICHEESKGCLNMFYKVKNNIAVIVIIINNKVFISGDFSFYKPYNFFRAEVEKIIEEAKRIKEGLEE